MKFEEFDKIKHSLIKSGRINESMNHIDKFKEVSAFISINKGLNETLNFIDDSYKTLNESFWVAVRYPIKYSKLKKQAKEIENILEKNALIDIKQQNQKEKIDNKDIEASKKSELKKKIESLAKIEKNANNELISDLKKKMDTIADNKDSLKKAATILKLEASISANKKLLKTAEGATLEELKTQISNWNKKVNSTQKALEKQKPSGGDKKEDKKEEKKEGKKEGKKEDKNIKDGKSKTKK